MTEHIVRTEKRLGEGDRYPHEVAITAAGTWVVPEYHLGRWTNRVPDAEGTAGTSPSGSRFTRDDLNASVVAIALKLGRPLSDETEALMAIYEDRAGELPPAAAQAAIGLAAQAVAWLNEVKAPTGRRFVLEDALYLIEDPDQTE